VSVIPVCPASWSPKSHQRHWRPTGIWKWLDTLCGQCPHGVRARTPHIYTCQWSPSYSQFSFVYCALARALVCPPATPQIWTNSCRARHRLSAYDWWLHACTLLVIYIKLPVRCLICDHSFPPLVSGSVPNLNWYPFSMKNDNDGACSNFFSLVQICGHVPRRERHGSTPHGQESNYCTSTNLGVEWVSFHTETRQKQMSRNLIWISGHIKCPEIWFEFLDTSQDYWGVHNRVFSFQNLLDFSERKQTDLFSILLDCLIPEQLFLRTIVFDHPHLILSNLNCRRRAQTWCLYGQTHVRSWTQVLDPITAPHMYSEFVHLSNVQTCSVCTEHPSSAQTWIVHHLLFVFWSVKTRQKDTCCVQMFNARIELYAYTELNCASNMHICTVCCHDPAFKRPSFAFE